jgi:hypothetical protein
MAQGPAAKGAAQAQPGCSVSRATPLPAVGPRPETYQPAILWPEDTGCDVYAVSELNFAKAVAEKQAFEQASKLRCNDCEGGYAFDAWGQNYLIKGGNYPEKFREMLLKLSLGKGLSWKGRRYQGLVVATGQHSIGSMPCRQYHWTLRDGAVTVAEREGLLCQYKGQYEAAPTWHEVV